MWVQQVGPPGYHLWWDFLGGVLPLLFFGILIGLLVWALLRTTRDGSANARGPHRVDTLPPRGADAALEHLRYRYARGEVGREEFFRMSQDLGAPVSPPPPPPAAVAAEDPGS